MVSGVYSAPVTPALKTLLAFYYFVQRAWPEVASCCLSMVFILRIAGVRICLDTRSDPYRQFAPLFCRCCRGSRLSIVGRIGILLSLSDACSYIIVAYAFRWVKQKPRLRRLA